MLKIRELEKVPTEKEEQTKFVTWLRREGFWCNANANGGSRHILEAVSLKAMGVSKGFPDVEVPFPSGEYHGFYVEMKRQKGGQVTDEQLEWLNYLRGKGYFAEVARGFQQAKEMFLYYLSLTPKAA